MSITPAPQRFTRKSSVKRRPGKSTLQNRFARVALAMQLYVLFKIAMIFRETFKSDGNWFRTSDGTTVH